MQFMVWTRDLLVIRCLKASLLGAPFYLLFLIYIINVLFFVGNLRYLTLFFGWIVQIVYRNARIAAHRLHSRNPACFSARNVVLSVCVCPLVPMATNKPALATITGKPRKVAPSVPDFTLPSTTIYIIHLYIVWQTPNFCQFSSICQVY